VSTTKLYPRSLYREATAKGELSPSLLFVWVWVLPRNQVPVEVRTAFLDLPGAVETAGDTAFARAEIKTR